MKTRMQRVAFRAILALFFIVSFTFAILGAYNAEDPIGMFLVILLPGSLLGLLLAGLVVWVMRAFSPDLSDDSSNEERNDGQ